jgi:PPOX class probable F420-dependent enzyme
VIDPTDTKGAHALERLSRELIGWLTTITRAGQPQSMPIWFLWLDGEILFYSRAGAIRNRNLESNRRVAFHLNDDGRGDDLISIDGEARFDPDAPAGKDNPTYLAKYKGLLDEYTWTPEYFTEHYPHAVRIRPTRIRIE